MPDVRPGRHGNELFRLRDALHRLGARQRLRIETLGQAVDLLDVEHGVALHEGNGAFAGLAAICIRLGADDLVGVHDKTPLLALADVGLEFQRLLEGHPDRGGVSLRHRGRPQHQDIDALIGDAVAAQRSRDAPGGMLGVPWFHPRPNAFLKLAHDLIGDLLINVCSHCLSFRDLRVAHATD